MTLPPACDCTANTLVSTLPKGVGVGFKPAYFDALMSADSGLGFIEIHAENYLSDGGLAHRQLSELRARYALSIHGVGLSIGGNEPLNKAHLQRIRALCERYQPMSFSEHLAWSSHGGRYYADLLPIAYNAASLQSVCDHVEQVQDALQRRILIENPSVYFDLAGSTMDEIAFLNELSARSGCGLLLDVNNAQVSCANSNADANAYLRSFPHQRVGEIHLAGHSVVTLPGGGALRIDDHGSVIKPSTWSLYQQALALAGALPTLIEWDKELPAWPVLKAQAQHAQTYMQRSSTAYTAAYTAAQPATQAAQVLAAS